MLRLRSFPAQLVLLKMSSKDEELADVRNLHAVALDGTPTSEFTTVSLVLGNTVGIKVTFTADNITNKSIRVDFNGETQYFSGADLVLDDNQPGKASFTYSLYANQLKDTVRFTVCEGDDHTPISDTMTYSAASYAGKYINNPNFGHSPQSYDALRKGCGGICCRIIQRRQVNNYKNSRRICVGSFF